MNIEERYKCFIARLKYELDKHEHGGKAYIAKNTGISGAFIGQITKNNAEKKAGPSTQIKIGEFISGSDERFIAEGKEILLKGKLSTESPHKKQQCSVSNIKDEANKKHAAVIEQFKDRKLALEINEMLVELERRDPSKLATAKDVISGLLAGTPGETENPKNGTNNQET